MRWRFHVHVYLKLLNTYMLTNGLYSLQINLKN